MKRVIGLFCIASYFFCSRSCFFIRISYLLKIDSSLFNSEDIFSAIDNNAVSYSFVIWTIRALLAFSFSSSNFNLSMICSFSRILINN